MKSCTMIRLSKDNFHASYKTEKSRQKATLLSEANLKPSQKFKIDPCAKKFIS